MNRKHQLRELIGLNKNTISGAEQQIAIFLRELEAIKNKEKRPVDKDLRDLQRRIVTDPSPENYARLTKCALRSENGFFLVWRGAQGAPPESSFLEIEQPVFNSENVLKEAPVVKQHFQAVAIQSLTDLMRFLPLGPTGLAILPQGDYVPFKSGIRTLIQDITAANKTRPPEQTVAAFIAGEDVYGESNAVYEPLYDVNTVEASGTDQLNFFQVPLGGTSAGEMYKTQVRTNMIQGGSMPYPRSFLVTGFSIIPDYRTPYEDAIKMLETSWCRMFIGTMDFIWGPSKMMALSPAPINPAASFRLRDPLDPVYVLPEPLQLISQQNFRFEINFPSPQQFTQSFDVMVVLHGLHRYTPREPDK